MAVFTHIWLTGCFKLLDNESEKGKEKGGGREGGGEKKEGERGVEGEGMKRTKEKGEREM